MTRKNKNITVILILFLLISLMAFTVYKASTSYSSINNTSTNQNIEKPKEMTDEGTKKQEPQKPDGEDDKLISDDNTIKEPPEIPDNNNDKEIPQKEFYKTNTLNLVYYILFIIEGLLLSILIMYLILSKFNKLSLRKTFEVKDKIIIMILSVIILTEIIFFSNKRITLRLLANNNIKNNQMTDSNNNQNITYSANTEITEDMKLSNKDYNSNENDENALLISGDVDVDLSNINIYKTGDSDNSDNISFYGYNSAILARLGATVNIDNITISSNAEGSNGVFCYGGFIDSNNSSNDGTTINISNSKITTTEDNSGGIMTTGGGIMNVNNLIITTEGISSAAIRTDKGGGIVNVDSGIYKTLGKGSPSIYSTADITVKNAELISNSSEGVIIEGKNSITLDNVTLTDTNDTLNGQSTTYKNIFIYQSMSGDASNGQANFNASNSKITTNKGDSIYVTNTKAKIYLKNNTFVNTDTSGNFLRIQKDSWGNSGSNGGEVILTMENQSINGNITIDSLSTLDMNINSSSYFEGTINNENSAKSILLKLDKSSKIKLTGDSYLKSLDNKDTDNSNIDFNGYKLYVSGKVLTK